MTKPSEESVGPVGTWSWRAGKRLVEHHDGADGTIRLGLPSPSPGQLCRSHWHASSLPPTMTSKSTTVTCLDLWFFSRAVSPLIVNRQARSGDNERGEEASLEHGEEARSCFLPHNVERLLYF